MSSADNHPTTTNSPYPSSSRRLRLSRLTLSPRASSSPNSTASLCRLRRLFPRTQMPAFRTNTSASQSTFPHPLQTPTPPLPLPPLPLHQIAGPARHTAAPHSPPPSTAPRPRPPNSVDPRPVASHPPLPYILPHWTMTSSSQNSTTSLFIPAPRPTHQCLQQSVNAQLSPMALKESSWYPMSN